MGRPTTNDDAVARRLAVAALATLAAEGAEAVTVRGVAASAGTSTTAIYSLFGGKDRLVAAALAQAAGELFEALDSASRSGDAAAEGRAGGDAPSALARLEAMGGAYLRWARHNPRLYTALFGGASTFTPSAGPARLGDHDPARPLMQAIGQALATGQLDGEPHLVATTLWAGLHGLATLTATCAIDPTTAQQAEPALVHALLRGWAPR